MNCTEGVIILKRSGYDYTEEVIILKRSVYKLYWRSNNIKKKWLWIVLKGVIILKRSVYVFWRGNTFLRDVY